MKNLISINLAILWLSVQFVQLILKFRRQKKEKESGLALRKNAIKCNCHSDKSMVLFSRSDLILKPLQQLLNELKKELSLQLCKKYWIVLLLEKLDYLRSKDHF